VKAITARAAVGLFASAGALLVACGTSGLGAEPSDAGGPAQSSDAGLAWDASAATDATLPPVPDGSVVPPADVTVPPGPDATTLDAAPDAAPVPCVPVGSVVTWTNGNVQVAYDLSAGTAAFSYAGVKKLIDFYAGVSLPTYTTSRQYTTRTCVVVGSRAVVTSTASGRPTMVQSFDLNGGNKFLAQVTLAGSALATNWIAPVVMSSAGGLDVGSYGDVRALWIPYDNDAWVSYNALPIAGSGTSFEAAAFYDNVTRNGVVVGSVTHDTWKTGVYYSGSNGKLDALNVFGGAVDPTWTHDPLPHGMVSGSTLVSPVMFVGYAPDWRDAMEEYADANLAAQPKLAWSAGVPFGWNSWGELKSNISYDAAAGVSDYIRNNLQEAGFADDGAVYVNLDSYWDNLSSAQLDAFVAHCHANGQKAGIYWAPFVDWGQSATRQVEGTTFLYGDIWLKDASGKPIALDGAYAVDPTHPGTKGRINTFIDMFKSKGFEYVKLDFLTHGALESTVRADPNVQTGVQAYNQGMAYIAARINGSMFISESISPLFPHGYAHARRVACDSFGAAVGSMSAEYEMNSASYGWWMSGRLYPFNDPDEMVFDGFTPSDNMTRLISAVVSGTVFLDGDDLTRASAQALARAYLTNGRINSVARLGKAFRPVEGNTGTNPSNVLVLHDGSTYYLAVFNYTTSAVTESIDLARAGLGASTAYAVTDLWSGATSNATGMLSVSLDAESAKLFALE
jgi:hypothetical protein